MEYPNLVPYYPTVLQHVQFFAVSQGALWLEVEKGREGKGNAVKCFSTPVLEHVYFQKRVINLKNHVNFMNNWTTNSDSKHVKLKKESAARVCKGVC